VAIKRAVGVLEKQASTPPAVVGVWVTCAGLKTCSRQAQAAFHLMPCFLQSASLGCRASI